MEDIKRDFRFKACSRPPGQLRGCSQKIKIKLFQSMVMLEIICISVMKIHAKGHKWVFFAILY